MTSGSPDGKGRPTAARRIAVLSNGFGSHFIAHNTIFRGFAWLRRRLRALRVVSFRHHPGTGNRFESPPRTRPSFQSSANNFHNTPGFFASLIDGGLVKNPAVIAESPLL